MDCCYWLLNGQIYSTNMLLLQILFAMSLRKFFELECVVALKGQLFFWNLWPIAECPWAQYMLWYGVDKCDTKSTGTKKTTWWYILHFLYNVLYVFVCTSSRHQLLNAHVITEAPQQTIICEQIFGFSCRRYICPAEKYGYIFSWPTSSADDRPIDSGHRKKYHLMSTIKKISLFGLTAACNAAAV